MKLAFTSLVLLLAAAPGCGSSSHPTGGAPGERTGTVSEALNVGMTATILYSFGAHTGDGTSPEFGPLATDSSGAFYGTNLWNSAGLSSWGDVFKVTPSGVGSALWSFCTGGGSCLDGAEPSSGVVVDSGGDAYGETFLGGAYGDGVVYEVTGSGSESVLHSFCAAGLPSCPDGAQPSGGLAMDAGGNLYGVTAAGGTTDTGTVFKIAGGTFSTLYTFCTASSCTDGAIPSGGLAFDTSGNLYGVTQSGGAYNHGAIFEISGTTETVVYSFCPGGGGCTDGASPGGTLAFDSSGNLYGATTSGGAHGTGTIFKLTPGASSATVLYNLASGQACPGGLILDSANDIYGTLTSGTSGAQAFVIPSGSGAQTVTALPGATMSGLLQDGFGNMYGVTSNGGTASGGTIYELSPSAGKQLGATGHAAWSGAKCLGCQSHDGQVSVAEPIDLGSGNVFYSDTDYTTAGQNPMFFSRYYNSLGNASGITTLATELGVNWRSTYDRYLQIISSTRVIAERADGRQVPFTLISGTWTPDPDVQITLSNSGSTWHLIERDEVFETYTTASGGTYAQLGTIGTLDGYAQTLSYSGSQLSSVTDSYSRTLTFAYNTNGTLHTVTTPDSTTITYGYTTATGGQQLTSASFPTSPTQTLTYVYGASGLPFALTNITDENGNTYETWTYDAHSHGLTNKQGTGANLTTVVYNGSGGRAVTNALGVTDTYSFQTILGVPKVTGISRAATGTTAAATEAFTYDSNGFLATQTDWNGNQTSYTNNSQGMPTSITEAVSTSVARTTTITYDPIFSFVPDSIATPGVTESFTYSYSFPNFGALLTRTLTDTTTTSSPYSTNGQTRTWTNTWSSHLLATVQTPNTNTTTFGYNSSGALTSVTDALTHATNVTSVTGGGRPLTVVDPNSVTTTFTYDARQQLLTSAVTMTGGTRTTTFTYDKAKELTQTTLPDGSLLANTYDTAHRLTQVTDALSDYTTYTLDALGDRTASDVYHSYGVLYAQHGGTFDALGRLITDTGGRGQTTTSTFDKNGNALTVTDGNSHTTTNTFDALNRLATSTDANSGVSSYSYDAHDRVLSVTDGLSHTTSYVYDGFGDVIGQTSPDTGSTVYHYDSDGNLTQKVDGASVTVNQTFDALDRIATRTYPAASSQNVAFTYDQTGSPYTDGIGRLTSLTDAAGSMKFGYDERGSMTFRRRTTGSTNYDESATYDASGRILTLTYPSGLQLVYGRYTQGKIGDVDAYLPYVSGMGSPYNTFSWLSHGPFGPIDYIAYGNGWGGSIARDYDYAISQIDLTNGGSSTLQNVSYTRDGANNITGVSDAVNAANSQTLGYDVINRLTSATSGSGGYGSLSWAYDKVGNLTSSTVGSTTTTYALNSGTNQLASYTVGSGSPVSVSTNGNGNITSIPPAVGGSASTFTYNVANRLSGVSGGGSTSASYLYGAFGERVSKTVSSATTVYGYGFGPLSGQLLEENNGSAVTDYIYVEGWLVGMYIGQPAGGTGGTTYYVQPDVTGYPAFVTDNSMATVWSANHQPYGTTGTITSSVTQNIRFPGQFFDAETGFHQNGFRDYMPNLGRYLEADLIGLQGGMHPYLYVGANPAKYGDPRGLQRVPTEDRFLEDKEPTLNTETYVEDMQQLRELDPNDPLLETARPEGEPITESDVELVENEIAKLKDVTTQRACYLYQKVGRNGEHLKFGITYNPDTRYSATQLDGGFLRLLAEGSRSDMLELERNLHENLPIGTEEGQRFYIQKQLNNGLTPPPYGNGGE